MSKSDEPQEQIKKTQLGISEEQRISMGFSKKKEKEKTKDLIADNLGVNKITSSDQSKDQTLKNDQKLDRPTIGQTEVNQQGPSKPLGLGQETASGQSIGESAPKKPRGFIAEMSHQIAKNPRKAIAVGVAIAFVSAASPAVGIAMAAALIGTIAAKSHKDSGRSNATYKEAANAYSQRNRDAQGLSQEQQVQQNAIKEQNLNKTQGTSQFQAVQQQETSQAPKSQQSAQGLQTQSPPRPTNPAIPTPPTRIPEKPNQVSAPPRPTNPAIPTPPTRIPEKPNQASAPPRSINQAPGSTTQTDVKIPVRGMPKLPDVPSVKPTLTTEKAPSNTNATQDKPTPPPKLPPKSNTTSKTIDNNDSPPATPPKPSNKNFKIEASNGTPTPPKTPSTEASVKKLENSKGVGRQK